MGALLPDGPIDTLGVLDALLATPESVTAAAEAPLDVPPLAGVRGIVLVAGGADALVAEAVAALTGPWSPVPVFVHTGRDLPDFVSDEWRVVLIGRDDAPQTTDAVASAIGRRAVLTAVGDSAAVDVVAGAGGHVVAVPGAAPTARHAFAPTLVTTLRLLDGLGALSTPLGSHGLPDAVQAAIAQLVRRRDEVGRAGAPATLARRIGRTLVLAHGASPLGLVAARRLAEQVSADAKVAAFAAALPWMAHHELRGWGQHGDVTRQVFSLVTLRHDHEDLPDAAAFIRADELVEEVVAARHELRAEGEGPLAQLLDLVLVGDLLAWHLAQQNEIDPGPSGVDLG